MAFRFNNPLRQVANLQASINRGPAQFGQVSQALTQFNDVQKNIGRISSSIGQLSSNSSSLQGIISNVGSAGDVLNTLGGNSALQNSFRSVSALTRDVQSLVPGNSRVASQAVSLSKRAEDLFSNVQRNIQGIQGITGGVTDVLNGSLDVGNLANRSLGKITGGLNLGQISSAIPGIASGNISGLGRNIASGLQTNISGITGNLGNVGNIGQISSSVSSAISNITRNAPELASIVNNPVSVVARSVAELTKPIGERYDGLREVVESLSSVTSFDQFVNNTFVPLSPLSQSPLGEFRDYPTSAFEGARSGAGNSYSKIENPLRNYASFNYIITLGILSAEQYNNPSIYRSGGGFENYVIKQAGGIYDKRYQVYDEFETEGHAEYFIDDLEMDAVIAPNPNTNVALGTSLTFKVTEPYSMGNFIEAIIGSAAEAKFANYLDAPFCLRLDFVGWDEYGVRNETYVRDPIFIPIKISKIDMNVDGKGSIYEVKAVPMSETGLGDSINEIKSPINANGDFVHTVLETSSRSVSSILNDRVAQLEESGVIAPYDRYAIVFPKSREEFRDYLDRDIIRAEALTEDADQASQDRLGTNYAPELQNPAFRNAIGSRSEQIIRATVRSVGRMYAKVKTFAEDTNAMNEIGLSVLVEDTATGGNQAHGSYANSGGPDDGSRGSPARNSAALTPAPRSRDYQFNQGMTITEVVERMVLNSLFARERSTEPPVNGVRRWFKIDTYTFIEENPETEAQIGRPPRVYVFSVIPYDVDEAKFNAPNERPANTEGLKAAAAKEYNYIYTGKNEDVLSFDLTFNNAFMQTAFANFGQNSAPVSAGTASSSVARDRPEGTSTSQGTGAGTNSATGSQEEAATLPTGGQADAVGDGDVRRKIAEQFHDRITNQIVDMVTAEMEIFGDPFFIPQEMGNFVSSPGPTPNTSGEGTMRYQNSEVFVVVNFKTPFDYQIAGATIEFPKVVPQFSGLFSVWAVTNMFNGGEFKQRLKLIRRRGQDDPPTDNNQGNTQVNEETRVGEPASSGESVTGNTNANAGAGAGNHPTNQNPTTPNAPTRNPHTDGGTNPPAVIARNPTGTRFGSMDQALSAARAYQQSNPNFTYAVRPQSNGGFTIAPRPTDPALDAFGGAGPPITPTSTDLTARTTANAGANAVQPRSPAC